MLRYIPIICLFIVNIAASSAIVPPRTIYETLRKQGQKLYDAKDYKNALLIFSKVYTQFPDKQTATILADCYWHLAEYDSAYTYYLKSDTRSIIVQERLAECLARKQNYTAAAAAYNKLASAVASNKNFYEQKKLGFEQVATFYHDSADWKIQFIALNSIAQETAPFIYEHNLYFVTNKINGKAYPVGRTFYPLNDLNVYRSGNAHHIQTRKVYPKQATVLSYNRPFLSDLTFPTSNDSRTLIPGLKKMTLPFSGTFIDKGFRGTALSVAIGPISFSKHGNKAYFSRIKQTKRKDLLELCMSIKMNQRWSKPVVLSINAEESSSFHPFVSEDDQLLFFTSDRKGGKGGYDIYVSRKDEQGRWTNPENLTMVNTSKDEVYPRFYHDKLYLASDGWSGLGGMDLFYTASPFVQAPTNLGYPVNTASDDYAIVYVDNNQGYLASNRYGSDDVLHFEFHPVHYLYKSFVLDQSTGLRSADVEVILEQLASPGNWQRIDQWITDHTGNISLPLKPNQQNYRIRIAKRGYEDQFRLINSQGWDRWKEAEPIYLSPVRRMK